MLNFAIRNCFDRFSTSLGSATTAKSQPDIGTKDTGDVLALCGHASKSQHILAVFDELQASAGFALMRAAAVAERMHNNNIKSSQAGLATAAEVLEAPSLSYLLALESLAPRARLYDLKLPRATGPDAEGLCLRQRSVPVPLLVTASRSYVVAFVTVNLTMVSGAKGIALIWRFDVQLHSVYEYIIYAGSSFSAHVMVPELQDVFTVIAIVFGPPMNKSLGSDLSLTRAISHEVVVHPTQSLQHPIDICDSSPRRILNSRHMLLKHAARAHRRALPPAHGPVAVVEQFKAKSKSVKRAGGARRPICSYKKNKENTSRVAKNKRRSHNAKSTVEALQDPHRSIVPVSDLSASRLPKSSIDPPFASVSRPIKNILPNILAIVAFAASFALACV